MKNKFKKTRETTEKRVRRREERKSKKQIKMKGSKIFLFPSTC